MIFTRKDATPPKPEQVVKVKLVRSVFVADYKGRDLKIGDVIELRPNDARQLLIEKAAVLIRGEPNPLEFLQ